MTNQNIATAQTENDRMYLFSAEMNLRTMTTMAIWAYCVIFADGALSVLDGSLVLIGNDEVSPFLLNSICVVSLLAVMIILGFYIRAAVKAIVGKNGAKYFAPQIAETSTYFKTAFVLLVLGFFIVMQSQYILRAPSLSDEMSILTYILMVVAFVSGLVGILQAFAMHRRYLKEQSK